MIAWQEYGSIIFYSPIAPFNDNPSMTPPVMYFNGSLFISEAPYASHTYYANLKAGSMQISGYLWALRLLSTFTIGTTEFAIFGSQSTGGHTGGYVLSETGECWAIDAPYFPLSASVAKTDYGVAIGLAGYHSTNLYASILGFDGLLLRTVQNFGMMPYNAGYLQDYKVSTLAFALGGKYAYLAVARHYNQTLFEGYLIDTTTWQVVGIDSAFNGLKAFCSIGLIAGSLLNAFSCGLVQAFNNFAFISVPRWSNNMQSSAICIVRPRADNLFDHTGVEFSLPLDLYYSTPTPFGVFLTNKDAVIYCNPITSVTTVLSPIDLNVLRFVSPIIYFQKGPMQGSFMIVGYNGQVGTNFMLTVFLGTLTVPFSISYEQDLLYPRGGSTVGYPQFIFRPAASSRPSEFEIIVTEKTRRTSNTFSSYSDRTFFEFSQDGSSWLRMTGPIIADGTTLIRFTPPIMFPPGNYEWQVRRIAFGG